MRAFFHTAAAIAVAALAMGTVGCTELTTSSEITIVKDPPKPSAPPPAAAVPAAAARQAAAARPAQRPAGTG